jgi:hypothetical protein
MVHNTDGEGCGSTQLYHESDINSLLDVLNSGLDADSAATNYTDGVGGFFLATHYDDAVFLAVRNGGGGVINVEISDSAMAQLRDAGAVSRPIPVSPKSPSFKGDEFHIPTSAFCLLISSQLLVR